MKNGFKIVLIAGLLSACAVSPQQVQLQLEPVTGIPAQGMSRSLSLSVQDKRPSAVLGSLGGVYADTAKLRLAPGALANLEAVASQSLQQANWAVQPGQGGANHLHLELQQLDYKLERAGQWPLWLVRLEASASLNLETSAGTAQRSFKAYQEHTTWPRPKQAENQAYVNELMQQLWQKMLTDADIQAILSQAGR